MSSLRNEVHRFDPELPIEEAWMPPASWYTSADFYELERRTVFGGSWQPVVRTADLAHNGQYVSGCLAGIPWVVVRGQDGGLRAFHNVCRHKGREVVTGSGTIASDGLVCGYHAWTYDEDGRLKTAPRIAGIRNFDRATMGLRPMAAAEWGHWVWIHAAGGAPPPAQSFRELDGLLAARGWQSLRFHSRKSWDIGCNWKVYADNYLDGGYHIPHMHPTLNAQLTMASYRTRCFESCNVQTSDPTEEPGAGMGFDPRERIGAGAIYAWMFPCFMINLYGRCMDTNWIQPLGPDRCRVVYEFYFAETEGEPAERFIAASISQADVTQHEDIEICESVQRGLNSPAFDRGRYAPRLEIGEHQFHRLLGLRFRAAVGDA